MRIKFVFVEEDISAGRQVLLTHSFLLGRSATVHKNAKDAL